MLTKYTLDTIYSDWQLIEYLRRLNFTADPTIMPINLDPKIWTHQV